MADTEIHNPYNFDVLSDDIEINKVKYHCKSWSVSDSSSAVDSTDTKGNYRGSFYVKGKITASAQIQLIANTDKLPARWDKFAYDGRNWIITAEPNVSKSSGAESTVSITADEDLSVVAQ